MKHLYIFHPSETCHWRNKCILPRYMDVPEKCAQRGVRVSEVQLKAILTKSRRHTMKSWLGKDDSVLLLDFHPHVGDRAMASYEFLKNLDGTLGNMHHIMVGVGSGQHSKFMKFAVQRVANEAATEWLDGNLKLHTVVKHTNGTTETQEVKPERDLPEPTEDELRKTPGALEAYRGVAKLQFQLCTSAGSKVVIRPDKLKQFDTASLETMEEFQSLVGKHTEKYEKAFSNMDPIEPKIEEDNGKVLLDVRTEPPVEDIAATVVVFDSVDGLKAHAQITAECRSAIKGVTLMRDDQKQIVYAVATSEDIVINKGMQLGGVGGGNIIDASEDRVRAITWALPEGDKTWVQLGKAKGEEDGEDKAKFTSGTLYAIVRELESKSTKPMQLTSFGQLNPVTEGGLHKYTFSTPEGAENHRKLQFVLTPGKPGSKVSNANFFAALVKNGSLGQGVLGLTWRLVHDPVGNCLKPQRIQVTASARIEMTKGKPVKLAWPHESGTL